jgi:hypothetical protein
MNNKSLIKAAMVFGGGFLLFMIVKNVRNKKETPKSFDATKETKPSYTPTEKDLENAEIVATAYSSAMQNNEPASRLSELNRELTKEFGMRCYMEKSGKLVVCNVSGDTILTK